MRLYRVRVTHQFIAVLVVLVILQASAGAFVLRKVETADAIRNDSLTRANDVVLAAERLSNKANQEVAHLLGYLRGASTREQIEEVRTAFRQEADGALDLVEPKSPLQERILRIRGIEENLFDAGIGTEGETIFELIDDGRAARGKLLDRNERHRDTVAQVLRTFGTPATNASLYQIITDVDRERVAILEFEVGLGSRMSEDSMRTILYAINRDIVDAAAAEGSRQIRTLVADLDRVAAEDPSKRADVEAVQADLLALEERVVTVRASSKEEETRALVEELDATVARAEALGVSVPRGDVPNVGDDVTLLTALGHVMMNEQALRLEAEEYFNISIYIQHVVRGGLSVRVAGLQATAAEVLDLANEEAALAAAAADQELQRARVAIAATVLMVLVPVVCVGWFVVRRLRERLESFDTAAQAVSEGRFDVPPPPPKRDDFDALSEAWERMTQALAVRERELAHKNETLRQNDRMATLGSLVAGVAHEVNNPLAFIKTTEEMTLMDAETALAMPEVQQNAELRTIMEGIRDGAETNVDGIVRIEKINRMLKGFAGPTKSEREAMNLNDVIDGVLIIAHNRLKNRYRIQKDFQPLPKVTGSPQEVGQIILNLIINASDACPEDGLITISTRADGDRVLATVRDNGPGVDPGMRERLFQPFATSKPNGSGLGLHISRSIAEAHDGTLRLDDSDDGASFTLEIPVRAETRTEDANTITEVNP